MAVFKRIFARPVAVLGYSYLPSQAKSLHIYDYNLKCVSWSKADYKNLIIQFFDGHRFLATNAKSLHIHDYNFQNFRNEANYKNSVVQLIESRFFGTKAESLHIHDYNFQYFRKKADYPNLVVQLIDEFSQVKLAGPGNSFILKEQDNSSDGFFFHLSQRSNVMKLTSSQLKEIMSLMANANIDTNKYANALKYIDERCALSVERWPIDLSLYILDAWFIILGPMAFRKCYYSVVTGMWSRKLKRCPKHSLILMIYFIGMSKRAPPFLMDMLEDKLEHFASALTDEELAISSLSFFKTSTKIKSRPLLEKSIKAAKALMQKNERFNLISILKGLRLSDFYNPQLMGMLFEYVKKEHTCFNFVECTNFLAVFASQNVYHSEVYGCLENQAITLLSSESNNTYDIELEKVHPSKRSRVKDLARFLWAVAFVGHELKSKSLSFVLDVLKSRLDSREFEKNLPVLVDCVQSLILLNKYEPHLLEYVTTPSFRAKLSSIDKAKPKYQLYFIYRSLSIELQKVEGLDLKFSSHIPRTLERDVAERNGFQELVDYFADVYGYNSFHVCYIIPHIMISGIVISTDNREKEQCKSVKKFLQNLIEAGIVSKSISSILKESKQLICIEILDPTVCIRNSKEPLNLMKTKIRQLKKIGLEIIPLTPNEISLLKIPDDFARVLEAADL